MANRESENRAVPQISVICTAKNASQTIDEALQSVRKQTFDAWELVVVDDGSTDDTPSRVSETAKTDSRIRLVKTAGVGRAQALNLALSKARSTIIANLDADDLFHPRHLEVSNRCRLLHPEFAMFCTRTVIFGAQQGPVWPHETDAFSAEDIEMSDIAPDLVTRNPVCHSSVLIPKATLDTVAGYNESIQSQFDYDLWIRISASGGRIGMIQLPLVAKRIHMNQSFEARGRLRYLVNSARTQARAIRLLGGQWYHWPLLVFRFLWGLRPRRTLSILFKS